MIVGEYWDYIFSGDFLHAILAPYLAVLGSWFYAMLVGLTMFMLYVKSNNLSLVWAVGIILSIALLPTLPIDTQLPLLILLALSAAGIIYRLYKK